MAVANYIHIPSSPEGDGIMIYPLPWEIVVEMYEIKISIFLCFVSFFSSSYKEQKIEIPTAFSSFRYKPVSFNRASHCEQPYYFRTKLVFLRQHYKKETFKGLNMTVTLYIRRETHSVEFLLL